MTTDELFEPNDNDHLLMREFPDEFAALMEELRDHLEGDIRGNYEDAIQEAENEALDQAFEAEKRDWIAEAVAEQEDDDEEGDLEGRARELFDESVNNDAALRLELVKDAVEPIEQEMTAEIEAEATKAALRELRQQLKKAA